jgi:hypothetical protein
MQSQASEKDTRGLDDLETQLRQRFASKGHRRLGPYDYVSSMPKAPH